MKQNKFVHIKRKDFFLGVDSMYRDIPEFALVMIIGQDEISTQSFAKKYFKQEEMVKKKS